MDLSIYILLIYEIFYIYDQYYFINTALQVTDEITTDVFEHHAKALMVEHVEENPDSPLFLYLSLQNNHGPLTHIQDSHFSDIELELINNIPNEVRRAYTRLNIKLDHFLRNTIQNLKVNFFLYFISNPFSNCILLTIFVFIIIDLIKTRTMDYMITVLSF